MKILLTLLLILLFLDFLQTLQISLHPERFIELNPVLGKHPHVFSVVAWFGFIAALTITAALLIEPPILVGLYCAGIVAELVCVINNWRIGIRFT